MQRDEEKNVKIASKLEGQYEKKICSKTKQEFLTFMSVDVDVDVY